MGYELNQLMKQYGLTTRTMSPYSGIAAPTTLAADATAEQRKKFNDDSAAYLAQRGAYDQYKNEYQNRIASTSPYQNSPLFKGQKKNWDTNLTTPTYSTQDVPSYSGQNTPTLADDWTQYGDPKDRAWLNTKTHNLTYGERPYTNKMVSGVEDMQFGNKLPITDPNFKYSGTVDKVADAGGTTTDTTKKADGTAAGHYENQITGYMDSSSTDADGNAIQGNPIYGQVWVPGLAHGGPVRHFYGGGQNKINGGIEDLVDRYDLANPTELPVTYATADTGTRSDATVDAPVASTPVPAGMLRGMQESAVRAGEPPMQRGPVPPAEPNPEMTTPAPTAAPAAAPAATGSPSLQTLYEKYIAKQPKSTEMTAAEQKVASKNDALISLLKEQASKTEENAPSKAEMYFRLAAALANPTKSRGFAGVMENVGAAAKELADFQKSTTDAKRAAAAAKLQLLLKTGEIDAQQAKDELANLKEGEKEGRALAHTFALKEFETTSKLAEPQTADEKDAIALGKKKGTPEFMQFIQDRENRRRAKEDTELKIKQAADKRAADLARQKAEELTPKQAELRDKTKDQVTAATQAIQDLRRALMLNKNAFSNSTVDSTQRKLLEAVNSTNPRLVDTQELETLLGEQMIARLKSSFGGNPSNKEGEMLAELQGARAKNNEVRKRIIARAILVAEERLENEKAKLADINAKKWQQVVNPEKPADKPAAEGSE